MRSTFAKLLKKTARSNRNALMKKAFIANRIAKLAVGHSRRHSYAVKAVALNAIINKFPNEVELRTDETLPNMVVVAVVDTRFGLHIPQTALASIAG